MDDCGPLQLATVRSTDPLRLIGPTPNFANTYRISSEGYASTHGSFCKRTILPKYVTRGNRGEGGQNLETTFEAVNSEENHGAM